LSTRKPRYGVFAMGLSLFLLAQCVIQGYDVTIFPMRGKKGGVFPIVLRLEKSAALSSPPFLEKEEADC